MRSGTQRLRVERGNLLPMSPIAESVAHRAEQVVDLVLKRRKMALAYKRTHREDQRIALEQLDNDLAKHNINIPAIQKAALGNKGDTPGCRSRHADTGLGISMPGVGVGINS